MKCSVKEADLIKEIHCLTKKHQQLCDLNQCASQEAESCLEKLEQRLIELAILRRRNTDICKRNRHTDTSNTDTYD